MKPNGSYPFYKRTAMAILFLCLSLGMAFSSQAAENASAVIPNAEDSCFAFTDARLIDIMNRYISFLPESEKNQMLVTSILNNLNTIGAVQMVRVLIPFIAIVCIFLIVLIFLVLQLNGKNKKIKGLLSQKNEYDEVLSSRAMLEGMFDTVYEVDITNNLAVSPACYRIKGRLGIAENCTFSEMVNAITDQTTKEEYKELHRETFDRENLLKRYAAGDTLRTIDVTRKQDMVNYVWNRITICTYQSKVTDAVKAVIYVKNIQEEKETEQKLIDEADTDSMTGLYNKRSTEKLVNKILEKGNPGEDFHAMLVMDIDNFKKVNDTLGHSLGDEVLKSVSGVIKSCFREGDVVSRIGGDEFLAFMKNCKTPEAAIQRAKEILSLMVIPYGNAKITLTPTLSIGIALYPVHADNYNDLFIRADAALYEAKNGGRNCFRVYNGTETMRSSEP